jgi:PiT family inorganic phosphate transporter
MDPTVLVILVVVTALLFDFTNGWNDSANSIATVVSTRVLSPLTAVGMAAALNFAGAFASTKVAKTVGTGIIDPAAFPQPLDLQPVLFAAMLAAAGWVAFCTFKGLPISASHSLIGGLVGAAVAAAGLEVVVASGFLTIMAALLLSPLLGFVLAYLLLIVAYWLGHGLSYRRGQKVFGVLQLLSSALMAFQHGQNDAQKVMGVIAISLFAGGFLANPETGAVLVDPAEMYIPVWVIAACGAVIALGTAIGGWRVISTLGSKLTHLTPVEGFSAETSAGAVLQIAAYFGIPVSTTHTITGGVLGAGCVKSAKRVRWGLGAKIVYAWVFTLPVTMALAWLLSLGVRAVGIR